MDVGESDSDKQWYWSKRGSDERNGPVSTKELIELAKTGDLRAEDTVWKKGMSDWRKAKSVSTLSMQDVLKESEEFSEESTDAPSSTKSGSRKESNGSDGRYWYNKKRWAILFWWALVPVILWNGYEKYISSNNNVEWFEEPITLFIQSVWFPPVGWYVISKNRDTTGWDSFAIGSISPVLFLLGLTGIGHIITLNQVSDFKNNREKIIGRIVQKKDLDEAIRESRKYENALNAQGRKDERLFNVLDSLRNKKSKKILNEYEDARKRDYDRRIELLESAKEYLSNVRGKKHYPIDQINRSIENVREERDYPCNSKAGYYDGTYKGGGPSGIEMGTSSLEIEKSCEYEMYVDSDLMGEGTLSVIDDNEFEMDNGNILEIYNGTAVMMESGHNYNVGYKMYLQE